MQQVVPGIGWMMIFFLVNIINGFLEPNTRDVFESGIKLTSTLSNAVLLAGCIVFVTTKASGW